MSDQEKAIQPSSPPMEGRRQWLRTALVQCFCLLWMAPVSLLLYLNLHGCILGSSAWCPGGKCYPEVFHTDTSVPQLLIAKHDRHNHNFLGTLQLASKALEVWFILITSWLVYLITMSLAGRRAGLPIAYITRPNEFSEVAGLFDPLLWQTLPKPFRSTGPKKARIRIWIFVLFTVFLCLICNLMGPATAVLLLPTLQWKKVPETKIAVFVEQSAAEAPVGDSDRFFSAWTPNCTATHFAQHQWSCTANPYANQMDGWIESYLASSYGVNGITQQELVSFGFNSTSWVDKKGNATDFLSWAPSRQSITGLSADLAIVRGISRGFDADALIQNRLMVKENRDHYDSYIPFNNTVQGYIERNGPVMGVAVNMWLGYDNLTWWDSWLPNTNRQSGIRCYENYNIANTPLSRGVLHGTYTKCVKWGDAWEMNYRLGTFEIEGMYKSFIKAFGPSIQVHTWTSDRAAFFPNGNLSTTLSPGCLPMNAEIPDSLECDWDAFFTITDDSILRTRSTHVNTIHMRTEYAPVEGHPRSVDLMFDFVAYLNFSTYSFDPSPISNSLWQVTLPDLPTSGKPIQVDPAWTLAAWSVDDNGVLVANRSAAIAVLHAFDRLWDRDLYNSKDPLAIYYPQSDYIALLPIIQTLSLVDHKVDRTGGTVVDVDHPQLVRRGRIYVWGYGMSSRTARLGVVVACIGIAIVVSQSILGLIDRRSFRSSTQLLVAALEHVPSQEFWGKGHDDQAISRVPFRVEDMQLGHASTFKFEKSI